MWFRKRASVQESEEAVKESVETLQKTERRTADVSDIAEALRTLRERNHFAEQLEHIMGRRR